MRQERRQQLMYYPDLLCFSHLRWDSVFQRPHDLMSRFALRQRVLYVEKPVYDGEQPRLELRQPYPNLRIVVPHLEPGTRAGAAAAIHDELLERLIASRR